MQPKPPIEHLLSPREQWDREEDERDQFGGFGRQRSRDDCGGMFMQLAAADMERQETKWTLHNAQELFMSQELITETSGDSLIRSEVDSQIATAKAYPRDEDKAIGRAQKMMCATPEVAEQCFYSLPRAGKQIEGASARFSEVLCAMWGNCRSGARVVAEGKDTVSVVGTFHDLESNMATQSEVSRRITDKQGRRFSTDMIVTTTNAALAIAQRNAILKGIPKVFWEPILARVRQAAIGDVESIVDTRNKVLASFAKLGVSEDELLRFLKCPKIEDITPDDIATLRGTYRGLVDAVIDVDETFRGAPADIPDAPIGDQTPAPPTADDVAEDLAQSIKLKLIACIEQADTEESLKAALEHAAQSTSTLDDDTGQAIYKACGKAYQARHNELRKQK